ncbi:DUF4168 domain-containing protein [Trichocoleus desertorum AS-A10]|uniref:DUF4168 domain-containing protein n=1 Tax=Trichocoleus desertorum TaxID=1481672 RepID=UPI0032987992
MPLSRSVEFSLNSWCAKLLALLVVAGLFVAVWSSPAIAWAQSLPTAPISVELSPEQPASSHSNLDSNDIPSEKVNQFVHAFLQVLDLIERREGELQGAETESESLRVQREIETEALAIIATAGLTKTEYLQLLGLANTDSEFGERVAAQLQEANE